MSFVSGATLGRHLYIVGEAAHVSQSVLALDRGSQRWQSRPCTLIPRAGAAVAAASDTLFVVVRCKTAHGIDWPIKGTVMQDKII